HARFALGEIAGDVECADDDAVALERAGIVIRRIVEIRIVAAFDADDFHLAAGGFEFHFPCAQLCLGGIDKQIDGAEARLRLLDDRPRRRALTLLDQRGEEAEDEADDAGLGDGHCAPSGLIFTAERATTSTSLPSTMPS